MSLYNLGAMLDEQGKLSEAEVVWRDRLVVERKLYTNGSPKLDRPISDLMEVLYRLGKYADAEPLYRELR